MENLTIAEGHVGASTRLLASCFDMLSRLNFEQFIQGMPEQIQGVSGARTAPIRFCDQDQLHESSARRAPFNQRSESGSDLYVSNGTALVQHWQDIEHTHEIEGTCEECPYGRQSGTFLVSPMFRGEQRFGVLCANASDMRSHEALDILAQSFFAIATSIVARESRVALEEVNYKAEMRQLNTRKQVAADLHDTVAQTLCVLSLKLDELRDTLNDNEKSETLSVLAETKAVSDKVYADVRSLLHDLYQSPMKSTRLVDEVAGLAERFALSSGQSIELLIDDLHDLEFDEITRTHLVHIFHEALANVRRHAQAKHVRMSATKDGDIVEFVVEDDGVGFVVGEIDWSQHFGLNIMRARADRCGGAVKIHSRPGKGVKLVVRFPCSGGEERILG